MTERIPLNFGWEFATQYDGAFSEKEGNWEKVDLPHTVAVTPFNCFDESVYQKNCCYRKTLKMPEDLGDKRVFVIFMAAGHHAEVYANGEPVAFHSCGYTAFEAELTEAARPGEDLLLTVELDCKEDLNQPPFGFVIDYMTYGGLYREAYLEFREQSYIKDVFVIPEIPEGRGLTTEGMREEQIARVAFEGSVRAQLSFEGRGGDRLSERILAPDGSELTVGKFEKSAETRLRLGNARLYDALSPVLYTLEVSLYEGDTLLDRKTVRFGFRRAEFRKDGFYLNGRYFKLRGLNRHQSWPYVGYAMPASQQRLDAEILKNELGVNAVRTSHYPQSQHFIDRCDELGLLVFTEIPGWQHIGGTNWKKQALKNVREMVTQYRNHPSVILWGVRINESSDDDELYAATNAEAHKLDPTRQTGGVRCIKKSHLLEDVYTYNDFVHSGENAGCEKKKNVTSDVSKGYLVTEYGGHMFPTKSFDDEEHRLEQALRHATVLDAVAAEREIAGSFGWCMFDYNTHCDFGSGDRICYHGVLDMFRNPKFAAAVYAAEGSPLPMLEISSSMEIGEHPASIRGRLYALTNADAVRVYKNDVFIKEFKAKSKRFGHLAHPPIEIDDLIGDAMDAEGFSKRKTKLVKAILNEYAVTGGKRPSTLFYLRALRATLFYGMKFKDAYALYGKYLGNWGDRKAVYRFEALRDGVTVRTVNKTPMTELRLEAKPDRTVIVPGDTYEVVSVRLRAVDENGNLLPYLSEPVKVEVTGPLAVYGWKETVLRGGMGGLYLRTTGEEGWATLTLTLRDAPPVTLKFNVTTENYE